MKARAIAFYLPQYHPIPENDEFWGKGFTEWSNVAKAKPLFSGHCQPFLPSDLGFYDLRVPEVRQQQALLAEQAGIEGFCYWHYWFGNGKRALERIFDEVLSTGEPTLPFCLGWANESWTGKWHGLHNEIIFKQEYPGEDDHKQHFFSLLPAFKDSRYIQVDGKPIFLIYRPHLIPDFARFQNLWETLSRENGLDGIYWISNGSLDAQETLDLGINGFAKNNLSEIIDYSQNKYFRKLRYFYSRITSRRRPSILDYKHYVEYSKTIQLHENEFPVLYPNWDSTPRLGLNGYVLLNSNPSLFADLLEHTISKIAHKPFQQRIIFLKSWNEWAEGNVLEPSMIFGRSYLDECSRVLLG